MKLPHAITFMAMGALYMACSSPGAPRSVAAQPPQTAFVSEDVTKVAVLVRDDRRTPTRPIEDAFVIELLRKGYQVASRSDLKSVIQEMQFQRSGLTESDAARIGRILNVPAVLIVAVSGVEYGSSRGGRFVRRASMGARLVRVDSAEVLWIDSRELRQSGRSILGGLGGLVPGEFRGLATSLEDAGSGGGETLTDMARSLASGLPVRVHLPSGQP